METFITERAIDYIDEGSDKEIEALRSAARILRRIIRNHRTQNNISSTGSLKNDLHDLPPALNAFLAWMLASV